MFGIYEENDYEEVGVYNPQDIQKKINEQCLQMLHHWLIKDLLTLQFQRSKNYLAQKKARKK